MQPSVTIQLGDDQLPLSAIATLNPTAITTTQRAVVAFIQEWLAGTNVFTVTTSGSTGIPKSIQVTRQQMEASARATAEALQLQPGMTALLCLDPELIAGKMMMVRSLVTGMNLIVTEPVANPLGTLKNEPIDFAAMVPYQVESVLKSASAGIVNTISQLIVGGAPLSQALEAELQKQVVRVFATYGMTETLTHVALRKVNGPDRSTYFHALPGVNLRTDARSCLVIEAPYLNETIVTNDLVELTGHAQFRWLGRADHVINTGGFKVIPEVLEEKLRPTMDETTGGKRFFIYGYPHESWGQQVTLVVEGTMTKEEREALMAKIKNSLSRYEVPKSIVSVTAFIEVGNGKINRKASAALASPPPLSLLRGA